MKKKKSKKKIIIGAAAVLVVAGGVTVAGQRNSTENQIPQVQVVTAEKGDVEEIVDATGTVGSEEEKTYYSPVNAELKTVSFSQGDVVKKGTKLIEFDTEDLEKDNRKAELNLKSTKYDTKDTRNKSDKAEKKQKDAKKNVQELEKKIKDKKAYVSSLKSQISTAQREAAAQASAQAAAQAEEYLQEKMKELDSCGGIVECVITGMPVGVGEPVFDKLSANLGKAILSIGAVKGFEIGDGFAAAASAGSENNDDFYNDNGTVKKKTNHAGGVLGGMSDGSVITFRAAFKPTPSIAQPQQTVNRDSKDTEIVIHGRHDPIIVPRAVVVVETMAAVTVLDLLLQNMGSRLDSVKNFYENEKK